MEDEKKPMDKTPEEAEANTTTDAPIGDKKAKKDIKQLILDNKKAVAAIAVVVVLLLAFLLMSGSDDAGDDSSTNETSSQEESASPSATSVEDLEITDQDSLQQAIDLLGENQSDDSGQIDQLETFKSE